MSLIEEEDDGLLSAEEDDYNLGSPMKKYDRNGLNSKNLNYQVTNQIDEEEFEDEEGEGMDNQG
jgi:hypothetical protein